MTIFWKNYIYVSIILTVLTSIIIFIIPLNTNDLGAVDILYANKFRLFICLVAILCVSALISYLLLNSMHVKLKELYSDIKELTNNGYTHNSYSHINNSSRTNIEDTILYLRNSIKEYINASTAEIKSLQSERNQLLILINAINEGIAVITRKGKIRTSNDQFRKIFDVTNDPTGRLYWEVIRINEINDLIESGIQGRKSVVRETSIIHPVQKYYLVNIISISTSSSANEIIAIFYDITEFKNLEKIKADLIANVSHELRTPLTAIKGYVETLEDEAYDTEEERLRFLHIIKKHTERLTNIVSDLLVLSEIEDREFELTAKKEEHPFENISIDNIINSCYESLREKIREKNLNFVRNIADNIPDVPANSFLLEQAFINLMDNAIKYTPEGGKIGISARVRDSYIVVEIFDTGIGIPRESIPRIFERFYRVDKDRSRKEGGTGLGLSIVKHVINMHNGDIKVESEMGKGTKFTIKLPIK